MGANEKRDAAYHGGRPPRDLDADYDKSAQKIDPTLPFHALSEEESWGLDNAQSIRAGHGPLVPLKQRASFGRLGTTVMSVVALAIVVPFVALLWAWAWRVVF